MTNLHRIENSFFDSNTFIVWESEFDECVLVDCGDFDEIERFLKINHLQPDSLLLTHGHFDHIYGLNQFVKKYPLASIYLSAHCLKELKDDKLNYSFYHESSFVYEGKDDNFVIVKDNDEILIANKKFRLICLETPGHDLGCISYIIGDYLFTGDSYIPGIKTVTHLRGNKKQAIESEEMLKSLILKKGYIVCPGHGEIPNGLLTNL